MKERPILFSAPMVRAILEGRKSQTRRLVSRLATFGSVTEFKRSDTKGYDWAFRDRRALWNEVDDTRLRQQYCPWGVPGDRLWVRETWGTSDQGFDTAEESTFPVYRADAEHWPTPKRWRPSIHMPRSVSRILLEVTGVRVERLQDISEADALAEGVDPAGPVGYIPASDRMGRCRYQYANLWDSINGAGSWAANPWVWAVSFRRLP